MKDRIKHKLNIFRSKLDVNEDTFVNVNLSGDLKPLPPGDINHVLNVGEEFNNERIHSTIYRLMGTITPLFSNPLMNMDTTGSVPSGFGMPDEDFSENGLGLDVFNNDIFKKEPFDIGRGLSDALSFGEAFNKGLVENNGWFGFVDPDITKVGICTFYDIEPTRGRFELGSYSDNWKITITYPSSADTTHITVNGGLLITGSEDVTVGGVPMVALSTATYHGLTNGDKVRLVNTSTSDGDFTVRRLGLDNGDYKNNYFVINLNQSTTLGVGFSNARMKRLVNGQESEYYIRKFKKLLEKDGDYEMYPVGFSNNLFNDKNYQFIINQDIDVYGLTDNLGRPLSELYLTIIKKGKDGMFHEVQSGLDLEFLEENLSNKLLSNIRKITYDTTTSHIPLENNITLSNGEFFGDIVEYNKFELIEKPLTDVLHRFNTINREITYSNSVAMGSRREGYLYKPHHLIKIREFSLFIEQGDNNTIGIPDYAENLGDGRYLWRDLLDIGIFDGGELLDYPFTNGAHYIHQNYCFMTTRQDPFSFYDLYYKGDRFGDEFDPPDPIGDTITDKFQVKQSDDEC